MSWKDILKEMRRLDDDSPNQPDYDARPIERQRPDEDLYDALGRHGFNESFIEEIKRMKEYEKDEDKFNSALSELDYLTEQFGSPSDIGVKWN